jgi:hypothetical protein
MLRSANEMSHKSVFDKMAGWTGWFWVSSCVLILSSFHPFILSSCHPVILSSCHPVILSDLNRDVPVLDSGFWVVERFSSPMAAHR